MMAYLLASSASYRTTYLRFSCPCPQTHRANRSDFGNPEEIIEEVSFSGFLVHILPTTDHADCNVSSKSVINRLYSVVNFKTGLFPRLFE